MNDAELNQPSFDPVSNILKWVLLVTAIICFALLGWATVKTYDQAPPHPPAFTDRAGTVIMSAEDIIAGKGVVSTDVFREQEKELIEQIIPWCPFLGTEEGQVGGVNRLPAKKLFDGKAHTIKGKARHDQLGPSTHQAEGFSEYSLTIRYLGKKVK